MKVSEEPTQIHIEYLPAALPADISPVERLILCSEDMVQTNLRTLLRVSVVVEVLSQEQSSDEIYREVRLAAQYPQQSITACTARSIIPINSNNKEFINAINEKKLGIGQILQAMGQRDERHISRIYADEYDISRDYTITGKNLYLTITEVFPRSVLARAGGWEG
jgi:chorismate-pyruvate lyase